MTVTTTPTFGLPYPEDNEPIAHLPDILQQQAEGIEKALTRFDFNGTDANRYAARLAAIESILAGYSPLLGALGTVRIGKPTYDPAKITLNDALLVRFNNLVIASMRFVYNAGVITHDNASYSPFTVPQGFGKAGSIRNRISITPQPDSPRHRRRVHLRPHDNPMVDNQSHQRVLAAGHLDRRRRINPRKKGQPWKTPNWPHSS